MTQDMNTVAVQTIANAIINGQTEGQLVSINKSYMIFNWKRFDGYKMNYSFVRRISKEAFETEFANLPQVYGITADWHTHVTFTHLINQIVGEYNREQTRKSGLMPFGKYKGQHITQIDDISYITWLAGQRVGEDYGEVAQWIHDAAMDRGVELGLIIINETLIDPNGERDFDKNTILIHESLKDHEPITYIANNNDGTPWSAYGVVLPCKAVGHPYYGVCYCLEVDGKAKRAKGKRITIFDYEFNGMTITAKRNGFIMEEAF